MKGRHAQSPPLQENARQRGSLIVEEKACAKCGYSLKGLFVGGACPECGRAIAVRGHRADDPGLDAAPLNYVATLGAALLIAAGAGVINFFNAVPVLYWIYGAAAGTTLAIIHMTGAVFWTGAILVTLRRRPSKMRTADSEGVPPDAWRPVRLICALTQCAWPAAVALRHVGVVSGVPAAEWGAYALTIVGAFGWGLVAIHTSLLADWSHDEGNAGRLRAAAWGFIVLGLGVVLLVYFGAINLGWTNLIFIFAGVIVAGWVASYICLVAGLLQLGLVAHWAIAYAQESVERDKRLLERSRRDAEARAAQERDWEPGFVPDPVLLASVEAAQREGPAIPGAPAPGSSMPRIEPAPDVEPYRVEGQG